VNYPVRQRIDEAGAFGERNEPVRKNDERIVLQYANPKARDWDRGAQVMVRNDLRDDLDECLKKLRWHTEKRQEYDGWVQALGAAPDERHELDIDDWLFFFGRA